MLEAAVERWPTQWYTFFDYWRAGREALAQREEEAERTPIDLEEREAV